MIFKTPSTTATATMRRPFRAFFTFSLTIVILFTFSSRTTMIRVRSTYVQMYNQSSPGPSAAAREWNSTLLRFAAIDFNEAKDKEEIEELLKGKFAELRRNRFFSSSQYINYHNIRKSFSDDWKSFQIRSHKYKRIGSEFQKSLSRWSQNKGFQPEIMLDLVDLIKHPIDRHYGLPDSYGTRYPSCAVVGNSGILLNTEYGDLIDSHDVVIRLNNALTRGFQPKVGSKTSISFVNSNILHRCSASEACFCHPYGEKVPIVMYVCQAVHFIDYVMCNPFHKAPLLITDARFDALCARIVRYYSAKGFVEETGKSIDEWATVHDAKEFHYSSGMQAIMLALGTCDRVSIFGFGKSEEAKHHYHSNQKRELHLHDYKAEYAFYHDLVNNPQVIPFFPDKFKFPPVAIYN